MFGCLGKFTRYRVTDRDLAKSCPDEKGRVISDSAFRRMMKVISTTFRNNPSIKQKKILSKTYGAPSEISHDKQLQIADSAMHFKREIGWISVKQFVLYLAKNHPHLLLCDRKRDNDGNFKRISDKMFRSIFITLCYDKTPEHPWRFGRVSAKGRLTAKQKEQRLELAYFLLSLSASLDVQKFFNERDGARNCYNYFVYMDFVSVVRPKLGNLEIKLRPVSVREKLWRSDDAVTDCDNLSRQFVQLVQKTIQMVDNTTKLSVWCSN